MPDKSVHFNHCCMLHGCKYGNEDCPVQDGPPFDQIACQDCSDEALGNIGSPDRLDEIVKKHGCPHMTTLGDPVCRICSKTVYVGKVLRDYEEQRP